MSSFILTNIVNSYAYLRAILGVIQYFVEIKIRFVDLEKPLSTYHHLLVEKYHKYY